MIESYYMRTARDVPQLKVKEVDPPNLTRSDSLRYVNAVVRKAAYRLFHNERPLWRRMFRFEDKWSHELPLWSVLSRGKLGKALAIASRSIYDDLMVMTASNPSIYKGMSGGLVTEDTIKGVLSSVLREVKKMENVPASDVDSSDDSDDEWPNVIRDGERLTYSCVAGIVKSENIGPGHTVFYPGSVELALYRSHGKVPDGYLTVDGVAGVCPSCADNMRRSGVPLVKADYFYSTVAESFAKDLFNNSGVWAEYVLESASDLLDVFKNDSDIDSYDLSFVYTPHCVTMVKGKGKSSAVGSKMGLSDFMKSHPKSVISGWAAKMKREGGSHPHTWCVTKAKKFAKDPDAFCASVYLAAFGKTPMQAKAEKKTKKSYVCSVNVKSV